MKISYNWLKEYLEFDENYESIGDKLTSLGLEVEGITKFVDLAEKCVSKWNPCKDVGGDLNGLGHEARKFREGGEHPAAVTHDELMRAGGRYDSGWVRER